MSVSFVLGIFVIHTYRRFLHLSPLWERSPERAGEGSGAGALVSGGNWYFYIPSE